MALHEFVFTHNAFWKLHDWYERHHVGTTIYLVEASDGQAADDFLRTYYGEIEAYGTTRKPMPLPPFSNGPNFVPIARALEHARLFLGSIDVEQAIFAVKLDKVIYTVRAKEGDRVRVLTGELEIPPAADRNAQFSVDLSLQLVKIIQAAFGN